MTHQSRIEYMRNITSASIVYPTDGAGGITSPVGTGQSGNSRAQKCSECDLVTLLVETKPIADTQLLIRNAADTATLLQIHIDSAGGYSSAQRLEFPIFEPWGVKLSLADGAYALSYRLHDYTG